jgi:hypothetical protein
MPFKSEKQRKWMHTNEPKMAKKWEKEEKSKKESKVKSLIKKMVREVLDEDKNPCWKGYKQIGMKDKGGKQVPNCVPIDEGKLSEQISSFHTIQRNNTLLKNKSMRYDGNDYKVTPQGKKYFKGTLQLEGKLTEKAKRDYKAEYKKYGSSTKAKKYRAELNKYNRKKGTYGNGDGKDASHKGGKIVGFEAESKNRGRAEKSRLKQEVKLSESKAVDKVLYMADHGYGKLGGRVVDGMSANLFKQVYEKSNDKTKEKINTMNEKQLYVFMTKLWSKFGKQVRI